MSTRMESPRIHLKINIKTKHGPVNVLITKMNVKLLNAGNFKMHERVHTQIKRGKCRGYIYNGRKGNYIHF